MAANDICRNKRLLSISRHLANAGDTGLGMQALLDKLGQLDDDMQSRSGRKSVLPSKETDSRRKMLQRDLRTLIDQGYVRPDGRGPARRYIRTQQPIEAEVDALVMDKLTLLRARCNEHNKPINMLPLLRQLLGPQGSMTGECLRIEPDSFQLIPAPIRQSCLEVAIAALRDGQMVKLTYRNRLGEKSVNELTPLYIRIKGAGLYLRARKLDGQERDYALQRFVDIQQLDRLIEEADPSPAFTTPTAMMQIRMRVSRAMEATLLDCKISPDQRITPLASGDDMSALVEATVTDDACFSRWILSWCNDIEIISPAKLREQVAVKLKTALQRYQTNQGNTDATGD